MCKKDIETYILLYMKYEIRKNTLPYIYPFSIIEIDTNTNFGGYKTIKEAEKALESRKFKNQKTENNPSAVECMEKRLENPDRHTVPVKKPRLNSRRIRLK